MRLSDLSIENFPPAAPCATLGRIQVEVRAVAIVKFELDGAAAESRRAGDRWRPLTVR